MAMSKRYTIFSLYMQGSNQSPQACHGINNLWKNHSSGVFSKEASALFFDWAYNSEVEIMLQGGYHADLEKLYEALQKIEDIPSAKFNESIEANNGACSLVTFVASARIVAANDFIRNNRLNPANAAERLGAGSIPYGKDEEITLTQEEIFVASRVAFLRLAS